MTEAILDRTVGDIVRERPATARVFEQLGIDFCCGGKKPLGVALTEVDVDLESVLPSLEASTTGDPVVDRARDCARMSLTELVRHILETHHAYLERELPRLENLVEKVARVHGDQYPELLELRNVFTRFQSELRQHAFKEEQILFPAVERLESEGPSIPLPFGSVASPIEVMEHEHDSAGEALRVMRELTDQFTPPATACNSWVVLLDGLQELESDLHWHIHKENNILFPRAIEFQRASNG